MSDLDVSRLGVQMYTCREFCKDVDGLAQSLAKVRAIGFTAVQASGFGQEIAAEDVARAAGDAGVRIVATHVGWDRFRNDLDAVIAEHKLWGCTHAAIGSLRGDEYAGLDGIRKFADELAPIAERLATEGIDFSYHNHDHEFVRIDGRTYLEALYDTIDARHLKAELDVHWVQRGGGDPAAWIRRYPGRQPLLHLKDMAVVLVDDKREPRFAEVGEGNMNWPAILAAAHEAKVEWYLVEQDNCYGRDPFESLAVSYRNLHAMGLR